MITDEGGTKESFYRERRSPVKAPVTSSRFESVAEERFIIDDTNFCSIGHVCVNHVSELAIIVMHREKYFFRKQVEQLTER